MFTQELLQNQVILVTGGGTGLGKSMAKAISRHGATVILASRKAEVLAAAKAEFESESLNCRVKTCDVRSPEEVNDLISWIVEECGHLDAVINNAAGNFISPTELLSPKGFDVIVDIVLKGTFYLTHAAGTYWITSKRKGTILNITTTYADSGSGYVVPSACAKSGVNAMTRSLAVEWARYGIRLNAIAPGPIPTEGAFSRLLPGEGWEEKVKRRVPSNRFGTHEELANLALFLVSDLSSFITGEIIRLDGGEQLNGAGQFNGLSEIPQEVWPELAVKMRKGTK